MEGTVKFFNRKKGFGFINGDDGKDYFVHFTGLTEGTFLRDNDKVSFEAVEGERGLKAEKVRLLEKGSDRSAPKSEDSGEQSGEEQSEEEQSEEEQPEEEKSEEDQE